MRGIFFTALAVTILTSGGAVTATGESVNTMLSTEINTVTDTTDSISTQESSQRFLRAATTDWFADEERAKVSELSKLAKQLKLRNGPQKKLAAAAAKAKQKTKVLPSFSVTQKKFLGYFNQGLSPEKAKNLGKIKGGEVKKYETFFKIAEEAKARNAAAFKAK
ncbi:hypothetical protein PR003_g20848 [Phytophthora rubi]|uniref:RxLR effector protein n=1 Tax=Phytophthora rubi TaxID=129364 RepID=A0A6A3JLF9_9STRA|nr:hypothetical protein PR002_g20288 [Phytophthora rubi]KAE8996657.1 hypothetical protein PR001_g19797 [Phytophthora rubi]KAE9308027.1 hypothetical protein PR003_g20848 [Phytophthora rubi]